MLDSNARHSYRRNPDDLEQSSKTSAAFQCWSHQERGPDKAVAACVENSAAPSERPSMTGARVACRINDNFCALLESGPKPTVAAVESMALGGGLETALACNARICTPGAPHLRLHEHLFIPETQALTRPSTVQCPSSLQAELP